MISTLQIPAYKVAHRAAHHPFKIAPPEGSPRSQASGAGLGFMALLLYESVGAQRHGDGRGRLISRQTLEDRRRRVLREFWLCPAQEYPVGAPRGTAGAIPFRPE